MGLSQHDTNFHSQFGQFSEGKRKKSVQRKNQSRVLELLKQLWLVDQNFHVWTILFHILYI